MSSDLTRLRVYERRDNQPPYAKCFRAAVSMHCHTSHSRESLTFIPHYARRIPVISRFYENEMKRYGETIDFARAWWTVGSHRVKPALRMAFSRESFMSQ